MPKSAAMIDECMQDQHFRAERAYSADIVFTDTHH